MHALDTFLVLQLIPFEKSAVDTKDVGDRVPYITSVLFLYACEFNPGRSAQHIQGKSTNQGRGLPTYAALLICRAVLHSVHWRYS